MTMPGGEGGLDPGSWLEHWTVTGTGLSTLQGRDEASIRAFFEGLVTGDQGWGDAAATFFGSILAGFADLGELVQLVVQAVTGTPGSLAALSAFFADRWDDLADALTAAGAAVTDAVAQVREMLTGITAATPTDFDDWLLDVVTQPSDSWQSLLNNLFKPGGSGRSLADLLNFSNDTASTAAVAAVNSDNANAILAIRNNQAAFEAMDPTAEATSPVSLLLGSSVPTFGVTQSTATSGYIRIGKSALKGSIAWVGSGVTNITAAYLTVYKVDQTSGLWTRAYESSDVSFLFSGSLAWINHDIPAGDRIQVEPGEVYVIELKVRGIGTHTIAGTTMALPVNNSSNVWPSRHGQTRNGGTSTSPSTIADSSVTYSNNVPHFEFGIADGDVAVPVYTPRTTAFEASGPYVIPDWAMYLDVVACGGGEAGNVAGFVSSGGLAGAWASTTLTIGTDVTAGATLAVTVGAGGVTQGGAGGASSVSGGGMTTLTAAGGSGQNGIVYPGLGPGSYTHNGVLYVGGAGSPSQGDKDGNAPGGGGSGGFPGGASGDGAHGEVWIVARTT